MKFALVFILIIFFVIAGPAQAEKNLAEFNFGFEKVNPNEKLPEKWVQFGNGYIIKIDGTEKRSGNNSILIEPAAVKPENSFGSITYTIPTNYAGKEIELRGFLKLKNVSEGFAGLFLRINGDGSPLRFDNMQERQLSGSVDWTRYSIKLPLHEDGISIAVGALLTGKGQLWVDDLQVLIDGKDISEATPKPPVRATKDKEFDSGSKITAIALTKAKIDDLAVLGQVWGFLKYYHPAVAAGEYNWDYELFRILPKILDSKNKTQRNAVLSTWLEGLGTFEPAGTEQAVAEKVKLSPDLSWIDNRLLGEKLAGQLNAVRNAKRQGKNYYISLFPRVGNPIFKNENAYKSMNYPDAGFRLLSLFRYWNAIQYYFPNRHLIEENWNNVLPGFIEKFVSAGNELEYKKAALSLIARIHDTHASIGGGGATLDNYRGVNSPPVGVSFIENKAVVTTYWDQTLAEKSGLKIGDVIETINNRSVSEIVKERLELTPASNYPTKLRDIGRYLLRTNENFLQIKYKRGKTTGETQLECYPKDKLKISPMALFQQRIPPFRLIGSDISYLYPGSLKNGDIVQIIPQIAKTKGLIIDLRSYPSDFIIFSLGEFLMPKATSFVKFSQGNIVTPGLFTLTDELDVGKDNSDYYKGKVVILINEITQSQAEFTTLAFRNAPRATVIGSTTAGADGNISSLNLPGGISTEISGIGVYYPDGRETQRVGIIPDIVVKPTIKGIAEGKDEMLEKAIEIIQSN